LRTLIAGWISDRVFFNWAEKFVEGDVTVAVVVVGSVDMSIDCWGVP